MTTRIIINRDALVHNLKQVKTILTPHCTLMAVVKANAYGHGAVETARLFTHEGVSWLGVSTVEEGATLREAGIEGHILVFLPPLAEQCEALAVNRLTATVVSIENLRRLAATADRLQCSIFCHVYIDTGLGRLGSSDSLPDILEASKAFPRLHISGVYTHFGPPGSGLLLDDLEALRAGGAIKGFAALARESVVYALGNTAVVHASASTGLLKGPDHHLDMVRVGTLLYGQYPDYVSERPLQLREDTFALCSHIIAVNPLPAGSKVGYGGEFICRRDSRIATVPVGLAHGLGMIPVSATGRWRQALGTVVRRREARRGQVRHAPVSMVNGCPAPLVGRISMDQCCVDVTDVPQAAPGMEVVLAVRRLAADSAISRKYVNDAP